MKKRNFIFILLLSFVCMMSILGCGTRKCFARTGAGTNKDPRCTNEATHKWGTTYYCDYHYEIIKNVLQPQE